MIIVYTNIDHGLTFSMITLATVRPHIHSVSIVCLFFTSVYILVYFTSFYFMFMPDSSKRPTISS
jgi:hypothetical protein